MEECYKNQDDNKEQIYMNNKVIKYSDEKMLSLIKEMTSYEEKPQNPQHQPKAKKGWGRFFKSSKNAK